MTCLSEYLHKSAGFAVKMNLQVEVVLEKMRMGKVGEAVLPYYQELSEPYAVDYQVH